MRKLRLIQFAAALAILLFTLTAGGAETGIVYAQEEQEEEFSRSFDIGPDGSLTLANISGEIVVKGSSEGQVQIEAFKRVHRARSDEDARRQLERVRIEVSHTGNRVRVHTRYGERHERHHGDTHVSVDFEVTVPYGTEVSVKSVSGDVDVEDVKGELQAESVSGEVTVSNAERLVRAKSVSGNVEVVSATSERDAEIGSVSGDVDIRGITARDLDVSSVSGDVKILDASCGRASAESVSGDIRYSGSLASGGRYEFQSHSGDVRIEISEDIGFELEAETFSGEIESDFPLTVHSLRGKQREVSGIYGDGSAFIQATTFSGDVTIERR
jgi:DUF4097 and DUF4098 domain-containing protein YvlB